MTLVLHGPSYNPSLPLIIPEQLAADINHELQTNWMPLSGGPGIGTIVPPGGSIQAALDALPATGGVVTLSANTTYLLTGTLTISKPNTRLQAPSWATIIRRTPGMLGHLISAEATATNFVIRDITIDGNGPLSTSGNFELAVNGAESLVYHCQIINAGAQGHLALSGADSRADSNTIRGLGTASGGGYGIWAISNNKTFITNNHITGTAIDAIGFDGNGTQIIGNHIENCQCYASSSTIGGGQIAQYTNADKVNGAIIANNYIGMGGGDLSGGLELYCSDLTVTGNVIANQKGQGVGISVIAGHEHGGLLFTGNTVMNSGQRGGTDAPWVYSGVSIFGPQNNIIITGNRFIDTQATPTQQWGIWCYEGQTFNNVLISANDFTGNTLGTVHFASPGVNHIITDNIGVAPSVNGAFYAPNYGGVWDATHDVGPAINAAIAAAVAAGGGTVIIPAGKFGLATPIVNNHSGVCLRGAGIGILRDNFDNSQYLAVTKLFWIGAANATMYAASGAGITTLFASDVTGIVFDCDNLAAVGARFTNISHSVFKIGASEPRSVGIWMDTDGDETTDSPGNQHNDAWFYCRSTSPGNTYSPTGILIDGGNGSNWNTSFNRFHELSVWHAQGDGVVIGFTDNNIFYDIGGLTNPGNGTGRMLIFASKGYVMPNGLATGGAAGDNMVLHNSAPAYLLGTPSGSIPSTNNIINARDIGNGRPPPVVEAGASGWETTSHNPYPVPLGANRGVNIAGITNDLDPGISSVQAGGISVSAPGTAAFVTGHQTLASHFYAFAAGDANTADGISTRAFGTGGHTRGRHWSDVWGATSFSVQGDCQLAMQPLSAATTNATATRMTADRSGPNINNSMSLATHSTYRISLEITAHQTGGTVGTRDDSASWTATVLVKRGAAAANTAFVAGYYMANGTLANTVMVAGTAFAPTLNDAAAAAWRITIGVDTTNGCLAVSATGEVNKNIQWLCRAESVELAN